MTTIDNGKWELQIREDGPTEIEGHFLKEVNGIMDERESVSTAKKKKKSTWPLSWLHLKTQQWDAAQQWQDFSKWMFPVPLVAVQAWDRHPACSILSQKQHLVPSFTLTAHDHSVSLSDCVYQQLGITIAAGLHKAIVSLNVFTVLLAIVKG